VSSLLWLASAAWRAIIGNPIARAIGGALAALAALWAYGAAQRRSGAVDAQNKAQAAAQRARLETIAEVRNHEREAETQDDAALVDRLTRRD
jgi:hypothetical protein